MDQKIQVAITDDIRSVRENLQKIFSLFDEIEIVFTASDGEEAVHKMTTQPKKPNVILMDIEMRKMDGIEATRSIKSLFPEVKIIMLSIFEQDDKIFEAVKAGADGYLLKDERPEKIIQGIHDVLEGRLAMSPLVAWKTLEFMRSSPVEKSLESPEDYSLSRREVEILEQLTLGKNYRQIAEELFISPKTVRSHIDNIYKKLDVHSKLEASRIALENKWFK